MRIWKNLFHTLQHKILCVRICKHIHLHMGNIVTTCTSLRMWKWKQRSPANGRRSTIRRKCRLTSTEGHLRTWTLVSSLLSQQDMSKQFKSDHALDLVGSYPPSQQDISGEFKSDHALDLVRSDPGIQAVINLA
jgi:hypothetical protein